MSDITESDRTLNHPVPDDLVLHEGETAIMVLRPSPRWVVLINELVTLGLYALWWQRTAFVLTSERVIYRRGMLNTIERSLPLRFVQDAAVQTRWYGVSAVTFSTAGGPAGLEMISPLSPPAAHAFKDAAIKAARTAGPTPASEPAKDFTGTLRKLADLRDAGVLTQEEFAAKKAEILRTPAG